ncbi:hypothetical protein Poli38472_000569 [Pythium oligandrum]|uniref:PPM-type phosphatase domain-containing protein n=1 Tax=Pythium oligandrum TaxID=41045 RepID=A0A8K1FI84_PYTOL|nr:hypothetical protein Poli38472_000569 [Pythium oligandrum]|eukprot:TMW60527.1 hypothetical protein Poli38472_000569 [Pythium oligandrum]
MSAPVEIMNVPLRHATASTRGAKQSNEDRYVSVVDRFPGPVFGVFDGHGGVSAAKYLVRHLVQNVIYAVEAYIGHERVQDVAEVRSAYEDDAMKLDQLTKKMEMEHCCLKNVGEWKQEVDGDDTEISEIEADLRKVCNRLQAQVDEIASNEVKRDVHLHNFWSFIKNHFASTVRTTFHRTDEALLQALPSNDGSTAVLVWLIGHKPSDLTIYAANVGDSRAVLCRNGLAVPLTRDHTPDQPDEMKRILKHGGAVAQFEGVARVYSPGALQKSTEPSVKKRLAMSRSFGDRPLKIPQECVTCEPEISHVNVTEDDWFLVIATDGVWNALSNQEAVDIALQHFDDPKTAARAILGEAYREGSLDNITATVVQFAWQDDVKRARHHVARQH